MGGWVTCGFIGWALSYVNENMIDLSMVPDYFMNIFPGIFFYGLGYSMRTRQYDKRVFWVAIIIFLLAYAYPSHVGFKTNKLLLGVYPLHLIYSAAAIIMFNNIAKYIGRSVWPLTQIGRESMYWYCVHWVLLLAIKLFYNNFFPDLGVLPFALLTFGTLMFVLTILYPLAHKTRIKTFLGL